MTDDKQQRYLAAKEVLSGADWLFDEFINGEMRKVLTSDPEDPKARESAYQRARVATELKTALLGLVENHEVERQLKERREQLKEKIDGR